MFEMRQLEQQALWKPSDAPQNSRLTRFLGLGNNARTPDSRRGTVEHVRNQQGGRAWIFSAPISPFPGALQYVASSPSSDWNSQFIHHRGVELDLVAYYHEIMGHHNIRYTGDVHADSGVWGYPDSKAK